MTHEDLDKLIKARMYISDATKGPFSINWYKGMIKRLRDHKENGMPEFLCTINFLKLNVWIDADILIKNTEGRIAEMEAEVKRCEEILSHATL